MVKQWLHEPRERKLTQSQYLQGLEEAGYPVGKRTFKSCLKLTSEEDTLTSYHEKMGRKLILSDEQRQVLQGNIIDDDIRVR